MKRLLNKLFTGPKTRRRENSFQPQIEGLEDRVVLSSMGVVDFTGEQLSNQEMFQGAWLSEGAKDADSFHSLFNNANPHLDMNGDNNVDFNDAELAIDKIMDKVRMDYMPYNLFVVEGEHDDYQNRLSPTNQNDESDAIVIVSGNTHDELEFDQEAVGIAPSVDTENQYDQIVFVFAKGHANSSNTADEFINRVARTISHEMGHSFGLDHVVRPTSELLPEDFDLEAFPHELMNAPYYLQNGTPVNDDRDFGHDFGFHDIDYPLQDYTPENNHTQNSHQHLIDSDILGPSGHAWMSVLRSGELTIHGATRVQTTSTDISVIQANADTLYVSVQYHYNTPEGWVLSNTDAYVDITNPDIHSLNPFAEELTQITIFKGSESDTVTIGPNVTANVDILDGWLFSASSAGNNKSILSADLSNHESANDGQADSVEVVRNGDDAEVWINDELRLSYDVEKIEQITLEGSSDNDYVTVDADLGFHVDFDGNAGYDRFTVNGTQGYDAVDVWHSQVNVNSQRYFFDDVEYFYVRTESGDSSTTIHEFADVPTFVVRGDYGNDNYRINTTADPNGYVYLQGMSGNDSLTAANRSNTWDITSSYYGRLNSRVVFYYMENLIGGTSNDGFTFGSYGYIDGNIDGNGGTDRLDFSDYQYGVAAAIQSPTTLTTDGVGGTVSNMEELVGSNTPADRITGPNASMYWYITGDDAGYVRNYAGYGPFTFYNVETLNGGSMNDQFRFYSSATMSGDILGRSGTDTLSYYNYYSGVHVDLMENTATGVNGYVYQIENVNGSRYDDYIRGDANDNVLYGYYGNDILIGMGGDDHLRGSYYGRNILVGGDGADTLTGGRYEDLMIAGFTDYDTMDAKSAYFAYTAMRDVWTQTDYSIGKRVDILRSGFSSNGVQVKLDANNVHDDGDQDSLTGSYGSDWFWASKYDATDFNVYEDVLN